MYSTEDENAMKEQWQRKKAPQSEQASLEEFMKKKKEKKPQKDSKRQLSISQRFKKCTKRRLAAQETTCR